MIWPSTIHEKHWDKWVYELSTGCHLWTAGCAKGYPKVYHNGSDRLVTRIVCEEAYGPPKLEACHKLPCRNVLCINSDHLYWGTRQQNENDKRPNKVPCPYVWANGDDYQVVIKNKFIGNYSTLSSAIAARDKYMERL